MKGSDRIYNALLDSRKGDEEWKRKVDGTIAKFLAKGMTYTQAVKHTAMELNEERIDIPSFDGFFLKNYETRAGEVLFNAIIEGEVALMSFVGDEKPDFTFPTRPCKLKGTNVTRVKNLMTGKVHFELTSKTTLSAEPCDPEGLISIGKQIGDCQNEEYALINGTVIDLIAWKEPMVTPEQLNLKLNFRSGDVRSGFFVTTWDLIENVLPSQDDIAKFKELVNASDFEKAVGFVNEVCGEQRDHGIKGVDVILYGRVADNIWKDRDGNERTGKNLKMGVGGFIYAVDLLYDLMENKPTQRTLDFVDGATDGKVQSPEPPKTETKVEPPTEPEELMEAPPTPPPAQEKPQGGDLESQIVEALRNVPGGLSPQDLMKKVNAKPTEIAMKLSSLVEKGRVKLLNGGKFEFKK